MIQKTNMKKHKINNIIKVKIKVRRKVKYNYRGMANKCIKIKIKFYNNQNLQICCEGQNLKNYKLLEKIVKNSLGTHKKLVI